MIGGNIKKFRELKGMSQQELASEVGVVRQTVSKWEKGLSVPDSETLLKIAVVFNVSVSDLLCLASSSLQNNNDNEKIAVLVNKIEEIDGSLKREKEIKRKRLRIICVIIAFSALILLLSEIGQAVYPLMQKFVLEIFYDTAYIGGCDKPTQIYIESSSLDILKIFIFAVTALFAGFGIYKTKKGKGIGNEKI